MSQELSEQEELTKMVLRPTIEMSELLRAPAFGSTVGAPDSVATETFTFHRIPGDNDSSLTFERSRGYDADGNTISWSTWTVLETPEIVSVETDLADNEEAYANGITELTITGSRFGVEIDDIQVYVKVESRKNLGTTPISRDQDGRFVFYATISEGSNLDADDGTAEIVCTVNIRDNGDGVRPKTGTSLAVYVQNNKRLVLSEKNDDVTLV